MHTIQNNFNENLTHMIQSKSSTNKRFNKYIQCMTNKIAFESYKLEEFKYKYSALYDSFN